MRTTIKIAKGDVFNSQSEIGRKGTTLRENPTTALPHKTSALSIIKISQNLVPYRWEWNGHNIIRTFYDIKLGIAQF